MSDIAVPDEDLDSLVQDLIDEPISLGAREAWESYLFTPNVSNGRPSPSGRWRRGANSTEIATVRLFGWVHAESMLGPYGSMEHTAARWLTPANMAKTQKQLLVLSLPPSIDPRSPYARYMTVQARNLYYILRTKAGLPDLDWVMEDESRELAPENRTHWWITSTGGDTFITLTSKLWQEIDGKGKTGGSLPRNLYGSSESRAAATPGTAAFDDFTMATWPNPANHAYSRDPAAKNYRLAPLDAFDEFDDPISRANFQTALRPGTAVVVDVTMALWRIKDSKNGTDTSERWTDTFQLIMQQIKVVKPAPDPYAGAVYMDDLGPEIMPPPTPSNKRRASSPALELSPPTKKPLPSSPSKSKARFNSSSKSTSVSGPPVAGPSRAPNRTARASEDSTMRTPPVAPTLKTKASTATLDDDYVLAYDSDEQIEDIMQDPEEIKPKSKGKGKGKGRAK